MNERNELGLWRQREIKYNPKKSWTKGAAGRDVAVRLKNGSNQLQFIQFNDGFTEDLPVDRKGFQGGRSGEDAKN